MNIEVLTADYDNTKHAADLVYLLNSYAMDPMGGEAALPQAVQQSLVPELAKIPNAFSVLCYVDDKPAGLVNCFTGFSTFKCKPLVNIHDVTVFKDFRGLGLSQRMLEKVEQIARERGCCKLTLEVLEGNEIARNAYLKLGFDSYELDPAMGRALFWQKLI